MSHGCYIFYCLQIRVTCISLAKGIYMIRCFCRKIEIIRAFVLIASVSAILIARNVNAIHTHVQNTAVRAPLIKQRLDGCIFFSLSAPLRYPFRVPRSTFRAHSPVIVARAKVEVSRSLYQCHVIHDTHMSCGSDDITRLSSVSGISPL